MRYEVNESNFEIYFWDDRNPEPYQYQPNYPNGDSFDSFEEATAWADASIAAHDPSVGFYAPSGKGVAAEAKVDTTAKDQLLSELGLTPAQRTILGL